MSIFQMLISKMLNNKWIVGSLLLGLIISVALISSIPSYTAGVLQNLLIRELEEYQINEDKYPGQLIQFISRRYAEETSKHDIEELESYFTGELTRYVDLPVKENVTVMTTPNFKLGFKDWERYDDSGQSDFFNIKSLTNLEENIELINGRLPNDDPIDGVYEALVSEIALINTKAVLGTILVVELYEDDDGNKVNVLIKPVGTFQPKDPNNLYWFESFSTFDESFVLPNDLFREEFLQHSEKNLLSHVKFNTQFDYYQLSTNDIIRLLSVENRMKRKLDELLESSGYDRTVFGMADTLREFLQKARQLTTMLWSIAVPVLIMLALYLFMVSRLIVERQKSDIAILRSRGARKSQVFFIYLMEVSILSLIAFLVGPYLGLGLSRLLGASNGFLEFVQRKALPIELTTETYMYSFWTVLVCIVMVMIPVLMASRESTVSHKQQSARALKAPFWQKIFLDVLLLLVSWYGWSTFTRKKQEIMNLQIKDDMITIDPLLFFVPAIFIIGLGLLTLRIYPWFIRFINWLGRKYWPPSIYITLVHIGRSFKQYQFFMLFLIMTIAVGIFNAGAARTINTNMEEQIRYEYGTDVKLEVRWESDSPTTNGLGMMPNEESNDDMETDSEEVFESENVLQYTEPPFSHFSDLPGVENAAKVFMKEDLHVKGNNQTINGADLMAIESKAFGETAWFKPQLLDYHWFYYLNVISQNPSAVLISRSLASQLGVGIGDYIDLSASDTNEVTFTVYGVIDYWPSWNPLLKDDSGNDPALIVAHLPYVQNALIFEPYEVWLKLEENATSQALYEGIKESGIPITRIHDVRQELVTLNNSAFLLGINGLLTLGFLISLAITLCGFLLFWILTLKSRTHEYGVYRAMGLSFKKLITMMTSEQLLTSGMACVIGVVIGGITSRIFVPLFSLSFDAGREVPPFQVIFEARDEVQLYLFVSIMVIIGLGILGLLLSRMRINQAIKLGED